MISIYDNNSELKEEIANFKKLIKKSGSELEESLLVSVTKYILFLKQVQKCKNQGHYGKCLISDLLFMIYSLTGKISRDFYINYRSMIENYIRFVLELNDSDDTGVRNLFRKLENEFTEGNSTELINYIDGEYGKCCDYVHSNVKSQTSIYEYYLEIANDESLSKRDIQAMLNAMVTFFRKAVRLLLLNKGSWIDEAFYKEKQKLKYLISSDLYLLYKSKYE